MANEFERFLDVLINRYGSGQRLAERMEMSLSAFLRAAHAQRTFSIENCLILAEETGEHASQILRLAGKGDVADRIERLYGAAKPRTLDRKAQEILALWQGLSSAEQQAFRLLIKGRLRQRRR